MTMTSADLKRWREQFGLTQTELADRFGLSRNTIQNYESGASALPVTIKQACTVWEDQLKKEMADLGPLTLCYSDGPMWVDPYRPRNRFPMLRQEGYPTNSAALARVRMIWGDNEVHGPFIMERSGNPVWNQVELARVVDGQDRHAPTVRNTIKRLADYILKHSAVFVRGVRMPTAEEVTAKSGEIRATGEALARLADEAEERHVSYQEFEILLKRLHDLGSYPTNRQVSDVAHAIHGEEIVGRWRQQDIS
jgi:DNA-binding XRE family transcriptional regulator